MRKNWVHYLLISLLLLSFLNFASYAFHLIIYPHEWDPYEGYHIYQSWRFINGQNLYSNISIYPMQVLNYTPLFFVICGAIMKLSGLCFWPGRLIATAGALTVGGLIYLAIRSDRRSPFWATAGALLFFASPHCAGYFMPMVRVDTMVLALSLAGLYATYRAPHSGFYSWLAVLFYLLAFYTKPTAILAAAAGLIWLLTVDSRRTLLLGAVLLVSGALIFVIINSATAGEFYHQVVGLNLVRREPGLFLRLAKTFLRNWMIFFAAALAGLLAIIYRRENTIWAYFFVASLINIPMSSRHGAVLNYYLPIIAAMAIICGREAERLENFLGRRRHPRAARLGFLCLGVLGLLTANLRQYVSPRRTDAIWMRGYRWAFGKLKGDILLSQMHSLAFMNGKSIFIFPMTLETTCGRDYKGVDQSQLLADIREKRFAYVMDTSSYTFFSPRIINALNISYDPALKIAIPNWRGGEEHLLWTPRGKKSLISGSGANNEPKNLLNILAERGLAEGAVRYYRELLEIDPENERFHYNLGVALGDQGKIKEALVHFAEAVRLNPNYAEAHYNLSVCLSDEGKVNQARNHLEEALRLKPHLEMARRALEKLDEK